MTLPAYPNQLSLSDASVEASQPANASRELQDSICRFLAEKPTSSTQIAVNEMHGKKYMSQVDVSNFVSNYRSNLHNWVHGGSGDNRYTNSPYVRYSSSSNYNFGFSLGSMPLTDSLSVTVIVTVAGYSPSVGSVSFNGGALSAASSYISYTASNQQQAVYNIQTNYKNISSVNVTWNHGSGNAGSWASCTVIPCRWATPTVTTGITTGNITASPYSIVVGSNDAGGDGANTFVGGAPSGTTRMLFDAWWYNNAGFLMFNNPTGSSQNLATSGSANLTVSNFTTMLAA